MIRSVRCTLVAAACGLLLLSGATTRAQSQTARAPGDETHEGTVLGTGAFTSFVENMDRSLAFYHDVFGMEIPPLPDSGMRPYNRANPQLFAMFDIPGATERHQSARLPGTDVRVEIMEIQDVPHKTVPLRIQDPGVATLVFLVRDVDEVLARVERANVDVVTPGGEPVTLADGGRSVLIRDLDGRFIELRQPAALPDATATNGIFAMLLSIAVADLDRTTHVYRDVLGFTVEDEKSGAGEQQERALTGLSTVRVRRSLARVLDSPLTIEFVEYDGVDRQPLRVRIQDRGAARLQLRAENVDDVVSAMKKAGLTVVSEGGVAVPIPPNFKGALVADADNFFLTPFAPCDGCAPRIGVAIHSAAAAAQAPKGVTPEDAGAIQALVSSYAQALGTCDAEGFADLFAPDTGYFASGFRGEVVGRERLIALVESERHCIAPADNAPPGRPGGAEGPKVVLEVGSSGVRGVADLGRAGEYQDEYVKTPKGWRFASRTVLTPAEKAAGLDADEMLAIRRLSGAELGDYYVADQNGVKRLRTSGVAISVEDGMIKGRAYLNDGGYNDDVYERIGPGQWRIKSRTHVQAAAP